MSTIRPLATIAVLAALGVFLAVQIQQGGGPVALEEDWPSADPNLDEAPGFDPSQASIAPRSAPLDPFAGVDAMGAEAPAAPQTSGAALDPPMPTMPPRAETNTAPVISPPPTTVQATPPTTPAATTDIPVATNDDVPLPANIPVARYSETAPTEQSTAPPQVSGRVPSLGTSTPDLPATQSAGATNSETIPVQPALPTGAPAQTAAVTPASTGFEQAWPDIAEALDRDDLDQAHLMLSAWRDDPSLDAGRKAEVDELLAQLAGTVVYSLEHRLEPPHRVQPGESLTSIAQQYGVPWRLLAKINGLATPDAVQPGQTLKVIRGPFSAEVLLGAGELVLMLDGRYAGRFPVLLDGVAANEGSWSVAEKPSQGAGKSIVLKNAATQGSGVVLTSSPNDHATAQGRIAVASNDAEDLYDILSIGSEVVIRR